LAELVQWKVISRLRGRAWPAWHRRQNGLFWLWLLLRSHPILGARFGGLLCVLHPGGISRSSMITNTRSLGRTPARCHFERRSSMPAASSAPASVLTPMTSPIWRADQSRCSNAFQSHSLRVIER
jgi:hypothetical protein